MDCYNKKNDGEHLFQNHKLEYIEDQNGIKYKYDNNKMDSFIEDDNNFIKKY